MEHFWIKIALAWLALCCQARDDETQARTPPLSMGFDGGGALSGWLLRLVDSGIAEDDYRRGPSANRKRHVGERLLPAGGTGKGESPVPNCPNRPDSQAVA